MGRIVGAVMGLLMAVAGALLTFQALEWMEGPFHGAQLWATLGPLLAGLGVALAWVTLRPRS